MVKDFDFAKTGTIHDERKYIVPLTVNGVELDVNGMLSWHLSETGKLIAFSKSKETFYEYNFSGRETEIQEKHLKIELGKYKCFALSNDFKVCACLKDFTNITFLSLLKQSHQIKFTIYASYSDSLLMKNEYKSSEMLPNNVRSTLKEIFKSTLTPKLKFIIFYKARSDKWFSEIFSLKEGTLAIEEMLHHIDLTDFFVDKLHSQENSIQICVNFEETICLFHCTRASVVYSMTSKLLLSLDTIEGVCNHFLIKDPKLGDVIFQHTLNQLTQEKSIKCYVVKFMSLERKAICDLEKDLGIVSYNSIMVHSFLQTVLFVSTQTTVYIIDPFTSVIMKKVDLFGSYHLTELHINWSGEELFVECDNGVEGKLKHFHINYFDNDNSGSNVPSLFAFARRMLLSSCSSHELQNIVMSCRLKKSLGIPVYN
eukprot:TCONS_00068668-protein